QIHLGQRNRISQRSQEGKNEKWVDLIPIPFSSFVPHRRTSFICKPCPYSMQTSLTRNYTRKHNFYPKKHKYGSNGAGKAFAIRGPQSGTRISEAPLQILRE